MVRATQVPLERLEHPERALAKALKAAQRLAVKAVKAKAREPAATAWEGAQQPVAKVGTVEQPATQVTGPEVARRQAALEPGAAQQEPAKVAAASPV